ncbi:hypothetical protein FRB90_008666 [Tulasnella sp. 427]|nr:hypothetical protein FRB90_008666 [Tulasnella sp. 427]
MYSSTTTRSTLALALLLSTTASAYTLSNVTIGSADPSIQYYSPCVLKTYEACGIGSWYESHDERFYGGSAMIATDPSKAFGDVEPYLAYTFKAVQLQYYDNNRNPQIDLAQEFPQDTQSGDLVKVLAWSLTGLDPLKEHTVGIQHQARIDGPKTQLVFDYMVVTMTTLDAR